MVLYPDPKGGSMEVADRAEAESRGWTPSMGTFGINSDPNSGGGGGGGGGGQQQQQQQDPDLSAIMAGFAASSGFSIKQLEEQKRQFDETLNWQKQMWQQQGLPQLAIQQRAQDLEERKFTELSGLSQRQQGWVEEIGRRQAALAEKTQAEANAIAQGQLGLGQSQLGLQTLQAAANLSGPSDWIKAANFTRGVGQTNLPAFIQQLLTGQSTVPLGGATPGQQMSAPATLGGLANQMGAGTVDMQQAADGTWRAPDAQTPGTGTPSYLASAQAGQGGAAVDQAAQQLRNVYAAGGGALGPQQLEGLTPTEMDMFTGGGASVGADVPGFLTQYKRSRIGQKSAALV
jgi:hypothetical protein